MEIEDIEAIPTEIELKRRDKEHGIAPYLSGTPGEKTKTYKTIYKVKTRDGTIGWGETSNIMSANITKAIVEEYFKPRLVGTSVFNMNRQRESFPEMLHNIRLDVFYSGIEMAVLDAIGKLLDRPVYDLLGGKVRERVEFAYLYGMSTVDDTVESAKKAKQLGFDTFKLKVGGYNIENEQDFDRSLRYDTDRVVAAADACTGLSFRIDANQSWSRTDALRAISALESEDVPLEYIEQPLSLGNVESIETLAKRTTIPISINEDAYFSFNLINFIKRDAIDAAVLDLVPLGGISRTKQLAERAGEQNISVAHHCCFDLGIKTAAILHLVASTPAFDLDNDTVYYAFQDYLIQNPFRFEEGSLEVRDKPGLGIQVDEEKLKEYSTVA